jgi:ABC-type transport system substrate-binding protein
LFVFEDQGNSVMTIQALTDALEPVGTAVEVRAVDLISTYPEKIWVGRWNQNGQPQSGTYEAKLCAIDLSRLGVTSGRFFKITTEVWGGGEASADLKIIAVDTSPGPAAQSLTFD